MNFCYPFFSFCFNDSSLPFLTFGFKFGQLVGLRNTHLKIKIKTFHDYSTRIFVKWSSINDVTDGRGVEYFVTKVLKLSTKKRDEGVGV